MKRREFLKTACLATICILPACKSTIKYADAIPQENKLVVDKSLFLANSIVTIAYNQHGIGITKLDDNTFAASLLTCTHQGCAVSVEENGFICPCHGARFDKIGQVTKGPTEENLTRFITSTDQQFVYVHLS